MDLRTGKTYDLGLMDSHGRTETVVGEDGRTYHVINGDNCTEYCARVFQRNCFTRAPFGRAKCTAFVPAKRNG